MNQCAVELKREGDQKKGGKKEEKTREIVRERECV